MFPFYNQFQFPFFQFNRRRIDTISGIPVLRTTGVVATATEVRYDVNPCLFNRLPNEGFFVLDIRQASPTASAALPIGLEEEGNQPQSLLLNALSQQVQAGDLQNGIKYLIYYNKRSNIYQLTNSYPANIAG